MDNNAATDYIQWRGSCLSSAGAWPRKAQCLAGDTTTRNATAAIAEGLAEDVL